MTFAPNASDQPVDSLRLSDAEIRDLHRGLDQYRSADFHRELRDTDRFEYRSDKPVPLKIAHPGGTTTSHLVQPRDLSCSGMGFMHGGFVHPGSQCWVTLTDAQGRVMRLSGHVARCQLVQGRVHVIGVAFEEKIDVLAFEVTRYDEAVTQGGASGPALRLVSSLAKDPRSHAALPDYVDRMAAMVKDVVAALRTQRIERTSTLAGTLDQAARGYGYAPISVAASALCDGLQGGRLGPRWKEALMELGGLLKAAQRGLGGR